MGHFLFRASFRPQPAPSSCPYGLIQGHVLRGTLDLWYFLLILPCASGELETRIQIAVSEQVISLELSFRICEMGLIAQSVGGRFGEIIPVQ